MENFTLRLVRAAATTLLLFCAIPTLAAPRLSPSELMLIKAACSRSMVLIGENGHGDGATIAIKARLIPELVQRCGFSAIAFESSYYDFAEITRATAPTQYYDRRKILSAVGRIWNRDAEFMPLADWLARQSRNKVSLAGIDDQIGSAGAFYSLTVMPAQLAALVRVEDRAVCQSLLSLDGWAGLDHGAQNARTDHCLSDALIALASRQDEEAKHLRAMAEAFRRSNARSALRGSDFIAARDQSMADNLDAFRRTLPKGSKILVWVANAHAAIGGYDVGASLGQIARARYGSNLFSVGFSAAAGQFRWTKSEVRDVPRATDNSLEARILKGRSIAFASNGQLASLGVVSGSALSWHRTRTADWSTLFDALLVLREERPTTLLPDR